MSIKGVVFNPARQTVEIHDSHGRLFATIVFLILFAAGALWLTWVGYQTAFHDAFHGPAARWALIGLVAGPPAFLSFCYALIVAVRRVFDGLPDLIFDREGITDRWLGCGRIPWSDVYKVETWTNPEIHHKIKRGIVRLWVNESGRWLRACSWHVRLNHWLNSFGSDYPDGRLPVPAASGGCPIDLVTFLWLIAQYRPEATTETIEIDPLNDEFVYKAPRLAAGAIRTIYGGKAEAVVDWHAQNADGFHAAKWQRIREELTQIA